MIHGELVPYMKEIPTTITYQSLAELLDLSSTGALILDKSGEILYANQPFRDIFGIVKDRAIVDFLPNKDSNLLHELISPSNFNSTKEFEFNMLDSRTGESLNTKWRLRQSGGVILMTSTYCCTEQSNNQLDKKYQTLFDKAPVMIHATDQHGRIIAASQAWLSKLGFNKEEVIGRLSKEFVASDCQEKIAESILPELSTKGFVNNVEIKFLTKSGKAIDTEVSAFLDIDDVSKISYRIAIIQDVTDSLYERNRFDIISKISIDYAYALNIDENEEIAIEWNLGAFESIAGYDGEEFLKKLRNKSFYHPDDIPLVLDRRDRLMAGLEVTEQFRIRHREGHFIWIEDRAIPEWNKTKSRVHKIYGSARDISDLKNHIEQLDHTRKKLAEAYDLLETSNEAANIGSWELNIDTMKVTWSHMTRLIHEVPTDYETNIDTAISFYKEGDSRDQITQAVNACLQQGKNFDLELQITTYKGNEKWVRAIGLANFKQGKVIRVSGIFQDIDKRKRDEMEVQKLSTVVSQIHNGVVITNPDSQVEWINDSFVHMTGYALSEIKGKTLGRFLQGKDTDPIHLQRIKEAVDKREPITQEILNYHKDGRSYWNELSITPIHNQMGELTHYIGIQNDITLRKKRDQEIQRMQRIEGLGTVAGGIAHDFNNLLTTIFSNIELARIKTRNDSEAAGYLDSSIQAMDNAKSLTSQLLTFAKGGNPIKAPIDIVKLVTETVDFNLRGSSVKAEYSIDNNLWTVHADRGQLAQVLSNLIINAKQAMPHGGTIHISCSNNRSKKPKNGSYSPEDYLVLRIRDEGTGISQKNVDKIFEPYFSTKEKGHGLGLSIVHSIINQHRGSIQVESVLGEGTTFTIQLPAENKSTTTERKTSQKRTILLLEDNEMIIKVCHNMANILAYDISVFRTGEAALNAYKQTYFDVVIVDLTIPGGMGGKDTAQQILNYNADAKIIATSGYSTDPVMINYKTYGFINKLNKPYSLDDFEEVLMKALSK